MGFRSMLISENIFMATTPEFRDKWRERGYWVSDDDRRFSIASQRERKFYGPDHELFTDIQELLKASGVNEVELILFHECGGVDKVTIFSDLIQYTRPEHQAEWIDVDEPSHNYCYGCSDSETVKKNKEIAYARSRSVASS